MILFYPRLGIWSSAIDGDTYFSSSSDDYMLVSWSNHWSDSTGCTLQSPPGIDEKQISFTLANYCTISEGLT